MKEVVDKCSVKGCAIDIGTVIDNDDCVSLVERFYATRDEAELAAKKVQQLAAAASSEENAAIDYKILESDNEVKLEVSVPFSCQAEKIIFELSLRSLS